MREVPFNFERWCDIRLQPEQAHESPNAEAAATLAERGAAWAYEDGAGHVVAAGGLFPVADEQAFAWAYLGRDCGPYMTGVVRAARRAIFENRNRWPIVRAAVLKDFKPGHRLMRMLNFKPFLPDEPVKIGARVYILFQCVAHGGH